LSEQYCLGVERPSALVVNEPSRRPSPPAKITTQTLRFGLLKLCAALSARVNSLPGKREPIPRSHVRIFRLYGNRITWYRVIAGDFSADASCEVQYRATGVSRMRRYTPSTKELTVPPGIYRSRG
jgi:hypothetical protein